MRPVPLGILQGSIHQHEARQMLVLMSATSDLFSSESNVHEEQKTVQGISVGWNSPLSRMSPVIRPPVMKHVKISKLPRICDFEPCSQLDW